MSKEKKATANVKIEDFIIRNRKIFVCGVAVLVAAAVWTGGGACQPPILEKGVRATGTDDTLGLACSGNLYAAGISGTVCLGDSIRPVAAGGRRVEALPVDGVFTGRRFCHGGGHGIFTDNLRIGRPAVPLSVFCADLCVRGCRVEHGRHEGCLEDRQFGCCAENAGAGKTDVYRTRASGAGKHSGCDPDVLAGFGKEVFDLGFYWKCIGIQVLFAAAMFALTAVAAKQRRSTAT